MQGGQAWFPNISAPFAGRRRPRLARDVRTIAPKRQGQAPRPSSEFHFIRFAMTETRRTVHPGALLTLSSAYVVPTALRSGLPFGAGLG